jgi:hypothetical protein
MPLGGSSDFGGVMSEPVTVFTIIIYILALPTVNDFLYRDPLKSEWKRVLKKCKSAEAVQLCFREGTIGPEKENEVRQMLAEAIPVPVISDLDNNSDKRVLTIFVHGAEKNYYDGKSYGRILVKNLGKGLITGYTFWIAQAGALAAPIITSTYGTVKYAQHKKFKETFGYLPYQFIAIATYSNEKIISDDVMNESYYGIVKYDLTKMSETRQVIKQDEGDAEITNVSLQAWVNTIAKELNKYKIGSKVKPRPITNNNTGKPAN